MTASHNARLTKEQRASIKPITRADAGSPTHIVIWIDRTGTEHPRGKPCSHDAASRAAKVLNDQRAVSSFGRYDVAKI